MHARRALVMVLALRTNQHLLFFSFLFFKTTCPIISGGARSLTRVRQHDASLPPLARQFTTIHCHIAKVLSSFAIAYPEHRR
jgi:hypothetical protein